MTSVDTLDGPVELDVSDRLFSDVVGALGFRYVDGRHPYRALSGFRDFMITTVNFRYVKSPRFWRFTLEQTEDMLCALWPDDGPSTLRSLRADAGVS